MVSIPKIVWDETVMFANENIPRSVAVSQVRSAITYRFREILMSSATLACLHEFNNSRTQISGIYIINNNLYKYIIENTSVWNSFNRNVMYSGTLFNYAENFYSLFLLPFLLNDVLFCLLLSFLLKITFVFSWISLLYICQMCY